MALESLIVLIIVGAIAGWLAGQIVKGWFWTDRQHRCWHRRRLYRTWFAGFLAFNRRGYRSS